MKLIDKIKAIRKQYGFPLWLIKESLEYYDEDEDKAIKKLIEIYSAIGDHPEIVVNRNIKKFMHKANHLKAEHKLDEIRQHLDIHLCSTNNPYKLIVYYGLVDLINELEELIKDDD